MRSMHVPRIIVSLEVPLSFGQIVERTGLHPSSASRALKYLMARNIIRPEAMTLEEEEVGGGHWNYELTGSGRSLLTRAMHYLDAEMVFFKALDERPGKIVF